jgi:DNA-binding NarL/FixJ family response regulator
LAGVLAGEAAIPRTLVAQMTEHFRDRGPRRRSPATSVADVQLTSREWEVLDLLRQGLTTGKIAKRLVLSPVTVRTHVHAILRKLRVPDRDAAIRLFEES